MPVSINQRLIIKYRSVNGFQNIMCKLKNNGFIIYAIKFWLIQKIFHSTKTRRRIVQLNNFSDIIKNINFIILFGKNAIVNFM